MDKLWLTDYNIAVVYEVYIMKLPNLFGQITYLSELS